jgi:hypothetical protein
MEQAILSSNYIRRSGVDYDLKYIASDTVRRNASVHDLDIDIFEASLTFCYSHIASHVSRLTFVCILLDAGSLCSRSRLKRHYNFRAQLPYSTVPVSTPWCTLLDQ